MVASEPGENFIGAPRPPQLGTHSAAAMLRNRQPARPLRPGQRVAPPREGASPRPTFQRASLPLPRDTAKRLIRAGHALGPERKADEGGCGGLSRSSAKLPHCRLPLTDEAVVAVVMPGFEALLGELAKLGKPSRFEDYDTRVECRATTCALIKELGLKAGKVCAGKAWGGGGKLPRGAAEWGECVF